MNCFFQLVAGAKFAKDAYAALRRAQISPYGPWCDHHFWVSKNNKLEKSNPLDGGWIAEISGFSVIGVL
jgi:hypothetical protein